MEVIILIGIQATGKSTFYRKTFFNTHIRINLDMLKTRHREKQLFQKCLEIEQPVVIDNTNPSIEDRRKYISPAKEKGFNIIGYYFQSKIDDAIERNYQRDKSEVIPEAGIRSAHSHLELPSFDEGFDELFYVSIKNGSFHIESWQNEI